MVPFVCVRLALLNLPFSYRADVLLCVWSVFSCLFLLRSYFIPLLSLFLFPFACFRWVKLNLPYSYPVDIHLTLCDFLSCFLCLFLHFSFLFYGPYLCEVLAVKFSVLRFLNPTSLYLFNVPS